MTVLLLVVLIQYLCCCLSAPFGGAAHSSRTCGQYGMGRIGMLIDRTASARSLRTEKGLDIVVIKDYIIMSGKGPC
jgi:hypothetical protein